MDNERQGGANCDCCGSAMREYHDGYFCFDCYVFDIAHMSPKNRKRHYEQVMIDAGPEALEMLVDAVGEVLVMPMLPEIHPVEIWITALIIIAILIAIS